MPYAPNLSTNCLRFGSSGPRPEERQYLILIWIFW